MIQEVLARYFYKARLTRSAINFQAYLDAMDHFHSQNQILKEDEWILSFKDSIDELKEYVN